ncbi:MAG TPA: dipeptidase [Micropepsaceae bacterium]|nr:dipeptidase [Micropepsaceae bacterium]
MLRKILWGTAGLVTLAAGAALVWGPGYLESGLNRVVPHEPYTISAGARALHDTLALADLHSDTLLWDRDVLDRASRGHVDVPRLQEGNVAIQVFSVVTKVPSGLNYDNNAADSDQLTMGAVLQMWPPRTWASLYERALFQSHKLHVAEDAAPDQLRIVRTRADLERAISDQAGNPRLVAALLAIEGAHALEGKLENIQGLYDAGFRMIGITHFFDNELGGSMHGIGKGGLTEFGRAAVREMERLNITIDLAHASPAVVDDVLAMATRPVVVSHTGVQAVCSNNRNLSDDRMKRIAEGGGLIGIGYWQGAVCDFTPAGVVKALRAAITLVGIEHVALGSDYDGATEVHFDTAELAILTEEMLAQGLTEDEIRKVSGENVRNFLLKNLP